ncbi:MAG: hypothetical protein RI993_507 [Pseudomonadota bacterium]|jgi:8-amino-7-oxononanoate synthase
MINFTSALYLGLHHPSQFLQSWQQLTLGVPAALAEPPGAEKVAEKLAQLQGCEQGVLMPSTLHLFWDLFGMLCQQPVTLYLDEGTYAIARWGAERFSAKGVAVYSFRHHDPDALLAQIKRHAHEGKHPVAIADGFCPACGHAAPVGDYLEIVRRFGGLLVLDDTQALGILGGSPALHSPYGKGGGGMLRWSGNFGPDIVVGSSLAKGFGVPVAVLAGSNTLIKRFKMTSDTRVHGSPPSIAVIQAAWHALKVNEAHGNLLRHRLAQRVAQFRKGLETIGRDSIGGWFPVQTLRGIVGNAAVRMHQYLSRNGIQTVLSRPRNNGEAHLSFLITARHTIGEIDHCIDILSTLTRGPNKAANRGGESVYLGFI